MSKLDNIRIVLAHTSHPGNIGAAARAMKTMGLSALWLVRPNRFPDRDALSMASGAADIVCDATLVHSVDQALAGTIAAFALTARPREMGPIVLTPREAAREAIDAAGGGPVAFLFGNEESGLRNEDILRCQRIVEIPANPLYSSLNVAAAVQVMAYELRLASAAVGAVAASSGRTRAPAPEKFAPASYAEIEGLFGHFEHALGASGFLDHKNPGKLMDRLRRLFGRATLEREEVNILRGILNNLAVHAAKSGLSDTANHDVNSD
ncbi:MAG: RNA methyltransferase [Betaproteobacteria bacterium]|nr:RNA methyltransferase [Betaproteobacteria bacterium]